MIVFFQAFYYSKNMNHLNGIFARGLNGEFSLSDGNLPWKNVPELSEDAKNDMTHFKKVTMGGIVIMGFNTYRTFKKPLPERINVVIDRNCGGEIAVDKKQFNFFKSLESALNYFADEKFSGQKMFLIGGAKLFEYSFSKNLVDGKIYGTVFNARFPYATAFMPGLPEEWKIIARQKNGDHSEILTYEK